MSQRWIISIPIVISLFLAAIPSFSLADEPDLKIKMAAAAVMLLASTPDETWQNAREITASKLTRNRHSLEGELVRLKGIILQIEQLPPIESVKGDWYQMQLLVDNPNSTLGITSVSFIYIGDATNIEPKTKISFAGYFVGFQTGENAFGGTIESITIVGNVIKPFRASMGSEKKLPQPSPVYNHADRPALKPQPEKSIQNSAPIKVAAHPKTHPKRARNKCIKPNKVEPTKALQQQRPTPAQIIERLRNN